MAACAVSGYEGAEELKFCPECGEAAHPRGREQRKIVTVLRCDVVGSTALGETVDPEALRALLARYCRRSFTRGPRRDWVGEIVPPYVSAASEPPGSCTART
jgi:hypothetical protein